MGEEQSCEPLGAPVLDWHDVPAESDIGDGTTVLMLYSVTLIEVDTRIPVLVPFMGLEGDYLSPATRTVPCCELRGGLSEWSNMLFGLLISVLVLHDMLVG